MDFKKSNVIAVWVLPCLGIRLRQGKVLALFTHVAHGNGIKTYTRSVTGVPRIASWKEDCACQLGTDQVLGSQMKLGKPDHGQAAVR